MLKPVTKKEYIERLKETNRDFGLNNDYLEGKKTYEEMDNMEKLTIDFIRGYEND